jgi:hypothetical protein
MGRLLKLESISQIHELIGYEKPKHPLISLIETSKIPSLETLMPAFDDVQVHMGLYSVNLKNGHECEIIYGRKP